MSDDLNKEINDFLSEGEQIFKGEGEPVQETKSLQKLNNVRGTNIEISARRQKVFTLLQAGLTTEQIMEELSISREIAETDLLRIKEDLSSRTKNFKKEEEIGAQIAQYEHLYEQAMSQYHECPTGSSGRVKFLDLARNLLSDKIKLLQQLGLEEKVADEKVIRHEKAILNKFSPEQKKQLEAQLIQMAMQQTAGKLPPPKSVIDAEFSSSDALPIPDSKKN